MPQAFGDGFYVNAVFQELGCVAVPQINGIAERGASRALLFQ